MKTEFFQCNGATERHDELVCITPNKKYLLIFGYGVDADGNGYTMRRYYDHKPDVAELRADIETLINDATENKILTGFVWNGKPVWLSEENQRNYKAAYDITLQTNGATLPIKFKLGEDADGNVVYHTFTKIEPFTDFILKSFDFIHTALQEGWNEKDSIDYEQLITSC